MPILFSAVALDQSIVADFASCDGNFTEILEQVLTRIPKNNGKITYYHGPYLIHYIMENRHLYFCITNKHCQRSRAFLFLNEIRRRFLVCGKNNFTETLASQMYTYSEDYSTITVRKGELDELNSIGVERSEKILGEKVLFVNNPEKITYATVSYVGKSPEQSLISETSVPRLYVIVVGVIILIIGAFYISSPACCVVLVGAFGCSFVKKFGSREKKSEN